MNLTRKVALTVAATVLSLGALALPAPAHADSSWGCGGFCRVAGK